ncbi:MAG: Ig-like domain-containing protein, partial [Firmicutes bacterium]|nr:Ig-like domain-containing protein [Bacillota bacterium]
VASLTNATSYYVWVTGAKDSAGNTVTPYVTGADQDFLTVASSADVAVPTVTAQTPINGATDQAITVSPTVTFSEAMDADTVNTNTVQLKALSGDAIINSVVTLNTSTNVATIDPVASLTNATSYYVWVTGAKDSAGNTVTPYVTGADQDFLTVAASTGALAVTSIDTIQSYATADATYANGFIWDVHVTVPTDELGISFKVADFISATDTIPAENTRYCSEQSSDYNCSSDIEASTDYVYLTDAAIYTDGPITISAASDLDTATAGIQAKIRVMMKVPAGTDGGSYSGAYGVQSE